MYVYVCLSHTLKRYVMLRYVMLMLISLKVSPVAATAHLQSDRHPF